MRIGTEARNHLFLTLMTGLFFLSLAAGCGMLEQEQTSTEDEQATGFLNPAGSAWAAEVVTEIYGEDAIHGRGWMPDVVLGPSSGTGTGSQSTDVVSLGTGGSIIVGFGPEECILDLGGDDLAVLENAFYIAGNPNNRFIETARGAVSQDGVNFSEFPSSVNSGLPPGDPQRYSGFAGVEPVFHLFPGDGPGEAGGDRFDLAEVGLDWARYVRVSDTAGDPQDTGDLMPGGSGMTGFDLDAVGAIHSGTGNECF